MLHITPQNEKEKALPIKEAPESVKLFKLLFDVSIHEEVKSHGGLIIALDFRI